MRLGGRASRRFALPLPLAARALSLLERGGWGVRRLGGRASRRFALPLTLAALDLSLLGRGGCVVSALRLSLDGESFGPATPPPFPPPPPGGVGAWYQPCASHSTVRALALRPPPFVPPRKGEGRARHILHAISFPRCASRSPRPARGPRPAAGARAGGRARGGG